MNSRWLGFLLILATACAGVAGSAHAQLRTLPQNAKFARVGGPQPLPFIQLDNKLVRLAPGGIIIDENNRSILQGALPAGVRVAYTLDLGGDIGRLYILTAQEQAQVDSRQ